MKYNIFANIFFVLSTILNHSNPYKFEILNAEIVKKNNFEQDLFILLRDNTLNEALFHQFLFKKSPCLVANGLVCKCFNESLDSVSLRWTSECSKNYTFMTLSMMLIDMESGLKYISSNSHFFYRDHPNEDFLNFPNSNERNLVTLVLPLSYDDIGRCMMLINSLHLIKNNAVYEMYVIMPPNQIHLTKFIFQSFQNSLSFPLHVISEEFLFSSSYYTTMTSSVSYKSSYKKNAQLNYLKMKAYPYAIQMAIKLLISRQIKTAFYITLDADLLLLRPFYIKDIINNGYALYRHEGRFEAHPDWWVGSEELLRINSIRPLEQGFGVTPAILSTYGALLVSM